MKDLENLSKNELIAEIEKLREIKSFESEFFDNELLLQIAENYPHSYMSIVKKDLTIDFTSGQEFKKQNLDPKSFIGLSLNEIFGEHTPFVTEKYLKAFKGEEISFELFINNQHQLYKVVPLYDSNQNISRILAVVENITESKKAEITLKESEERFHQMFEKHNAVMLLIEPETGKIIDANLSAQKFYGYSDETFKQMIIQDINSLPEEKVLELRKQAQKENKNYFVFPHCLASGEIRTVEVHSSPIIINKKQILFSIVHDITERKQAEEALVKSQALVNDAQRMAKLGGFDFDVKTMSQTWTEETFRIMEVDFIGSAPAVPEGVDFIAQEYRPMANKAIQEAMEQGKPYDQEWEVDTAKGNRKWVRAIGKANKVNGKIKSISGSLQDITERKQVEENLREEKKFNENLLETANSFIIVLDKNASIILFNRYAEKLSGYKKEEVMGKNWFTTFIPKQNDSEIPEVFDDVLKEMPKVSSYENPILCKNGVEKLINWENSLLKNDKGEILGILSIGADITERKQAEKDLSESEEKLNLIINSSPVGICTVDMLGNFVTTNQAYERMVGYSKEELVRLSFFEVTHPNDRPKNKKLFQEMFSLETTDFSMEKRYIRKGGEEIKVSVHAIGIRDAEGNVIYGTAFVDDITERKQAEKDLQKSELKYRNQANFLDVVTENSPFAMWVSDAKGIMIRANQALRNILNLTDDMIIGKYNVLHDENLDAQGFMPTVEAVYNDLKSSRFTMYWTGTKAGNVDLSVANELWIDVSMFPITDEAGKLVNVVCQYVDITERKQAEEEKAKIYNSIQTAVYIYDFVKSKNDYINPEYTKLLGWTIDDINKMGNKFTELFHPDDFKQLAKHMQIVSEDTEDNTHILEYRFKHKNGQWRWCLSYDTPFQRKVNGDVEKMIGSFIDITERKQAEEKLRNLSTVVEQSSEGIAIADMEGNILYANNAWALLHSYETKEELIGKPLSIFHNQKQIEKDVIPFNQKVKENGFHTGEVGHIRKDGTPFPTLMSSTFLKDEQGNPYAIAGLAKDITERKQVEEVIKNQATKWQTTFNAMSDSVSIIDLDGKISQYNAATLSLFNVNEEDIKEKKCFELVHGTKEFFNDCPLVRMKDSSQPESMTFKEKERWLKVNIDPIFNSKNELTGAVHVVSNITERKKIENEVLKYQENLEELVVERTENLEKKNKELERFNDLFVDREFRIKELKERILKLESE